jgi:hypothetical protein
MQIALPQYGSAHAELPNVGHTGHINQTISQILELWIPRQSDYLPPQGGPSLALYSSSMHLVSNHRLRLALSRQYLIPCLTGAWFVWLMHGCATPEPCLVVLCISSQCLTAQSEVGHLFYFHTSYLKPKFTLAGLIRQLLLIRLIYSESYGYSLLSYQLFHVYTKAFENEIRIFLPN